MAIKICILAEQRNNKIFAFSKQYYNRITQNRTGRYIWTGVEKHLLTSQEHTSFENMKMLLVEHHLLTYGRINEKNKNQIMYRLK